eukprot:TRINITY_DN10403_c0_g1_i1.p1 TRINITY_DN10403_c0_g1~~TRINITY_DN10403_c0_g1_i1.p1  ORF type:complete len:134 (+),score=24.06 TRINITY_DN10403_c0_g1_i1:26-427(+)
MAAISGNVKIHYIQNSRSSRFSKNPLKVGIVEDGYGSYKLKIENRKIAPSFQNHNLIKIFNDNTYNGMLSLQFLQPSLFVYIQNGDPDALAKFVNTLVEMHKNPTTFDINEYLSKQRQSPLQIEDDQEYTLDY